MLYKCTNCKTSKPFFNAALTEPAYCPTCKCMRKFLPDTSQTSTTRLSGTHSTSDFTSSQTHGRSSSSFHKSNNNSDIGRQRNDQRSIAHPSTGVVRSSSMASIRPCNYFRLCLEFMLSLDCSKRLFNREFNRCYCENCYSPRGRDFLIEGNAKYVIPRGWVRFGLYVDDAQAKAEKIWSTWVVSYHGTRRQAAKSIIEHHLFLLPGDQCIDGHVIAIRPGHIPGKFEIYTSPTIAYSGDDIYCPSNPFQSKITGKSYKAKIVLQCRQQPGTFKIQPETIGATDKNKRICPIIPNSEVEYFTEVRAAIVPYGLLIRVFE